MERKIYQDLLKWKYSSNRKPLILQGARQIGKTYIVNLFGANEYFNYVYCNFEKEKNLQDFFETLDPQTIIKKVGAYKSKEILPQHTLIIFDEIQACPQALTSLKYFNEEANQYHIISMGSLLGVSVNRSNFSFPVGKVQFLDMYPMDFEEFLLANGQQFLIEQITNCFCQNKPMDKIFHEKAMEFYRMYLFVGGMPEVVNDFVTTKNQEICRIKQHEILESYFADMGKYNKASEIPKTKLVYQTISTQLAKQNKKFLYKQIKSGARASQFEEAIQWLCLAGISNQLFRLENISLPLHANASNSDFKFFMNDVGLCCANQNVLWEDIVLGLNDFEFKGGLAENYVNNQLLQSGFEIFYWTNKNQAEVDFVTRIGQDIIPIEVKSGDNTRAKSLSAYMQQFLPKYGIKISSKNFGMENNIKSIPLYAVWLLKK